MRVIRVDDESSSHTLLWIAAGALAGFAVGVVVAEKSSGRPVTLRGLLARGRRLFSRALTEGSEAMRAAESLRESWSEGASEDDELEDFEETEEYEEATEEAATDELGSRVLEAFENDPVLALRSVEIESDDSTILLHGRVHSAREIQHAVTIARGVPGVVEVRQRLKVRAGR